MFSIKLKTMMYAILMSVALTSYASSFTENVIESAAVHFYEENHRDIAPHILGKWEGTCLRSDGISEPTTVIINRNNYYLDMAPYIYIDSLHVVYWFNDTTEAFLNSNLNFHGEEPLKEDFFRWCDNTSDECTFTIFRVGIMENKHMIRAEKDAFTLESENSLKLSVQRSVGETYSTSDDVYDRNHRLMSRLSWLWSQKYWRGKIQNAEMTCNLYRTVSE